MRLSLTLIGLCALAACAAPAPPVARHSEGWYAAHNGAAYQEMTRCLTGGEPRNAPDCVNAQDAQMEPR